MECRHGRPECECPDNTDNPRSSNNLQNLSSGRWDANGSWFDATFAEREKAFKWAETLSLKKLHWAVTVLASDTNAFTLYERKAILEVVALKLGKEVHEKLENGTIS